MDAVVNAAIITATGSVIAALIGRKKERTSPARLKHPIEPKRRRGVSAWFRISFILSVVCLGCLTYLSGQGRIWDKPAGSAQIKITHPPASGTPGTGSRGALEGTVSGSYPPGVWVLIYACVNGGDCYIQPFGTDYKIYPLNGKWSATTHLGDRYVALLVAPDFKNPPAETANPPGGKGVLASDEKRSTGQQ
jgi:hypothetical protein